VRNPSRWDLALAGWRRRVIGWLGGPVDREVALEPAE
jgi:hypothetical protein